MTPPTKPVVLCIDDDPTILDSLQYELSSVLLDRYELETATGGEAALELMGELLEEDCDIALVVSDYIMPDLRGDRVLQHLHEVSPQTVKIMLTGQATLEGVTNAVNHARLYCYIAKPWRAEDLRATIEDALVRYDQTQRLARYSEELEAAISERDRVLQQTLIELEATQIALTNFELAAGVTVTPLLDRLSAASHTLLDAFDAAYAQLRRLGQRSPSEQTACWALVDRALAVPLTDAEAQPSSRCVLIEALQHRGVSTPAETADLFLDLAVDPLTPAWQPLLADADLSLVRLAHSLVTLRRCGAIADEHARKIAAVLKTCGSGPEAEPLPPNVIQFKSR